MEPIRSSSIQIGPLLRQHRERLGKTAVEVAERAAIPRSTLYRVETGTMNPTWGLVVAIAQALDLQPVLVPRERLRAVDLVMRAPGDSQEVPPLAGETW